MNGMQGIVPILLTPFDEQERIDEDSLRSEVDYVIAAGVHGVGLALGSEILKLTEAERMQVIQVVVDQVRSRVPVVVNTGAQATFTAALYSRQAEDLGASAVMCLPPAPASDSETRSYFAAISNAVSVPVFIQDTLTNPVSAALMRQIADETEHVRFAKVESPPQPAQVAAAVVAADGRLAIFGGAGGTFLLDELRRGTVGSMPWPSQPYAFVKIWQYWQSGDEHGAREVHEREILRVALLSIAGLRLGHIVHKELLRRQGVIRSARVRGPSDPLDAQTQRDFDELCERLGVGSGVA
jgi:dihydrodipicolinate synthase/N-acetylneuraminate lyase